MDGDVTPPPNDDAVRELREAEKRATPGPWTMTRGDSFLSQATVSSTAKMLFVFEDTGHENDAKFIALARNHLPAILDELERLRAVRDAANEVVQNAFANNNSPLVEVIAVHEKGGRGNQIGTMPFDKLRAALARGGAQ